MLSCMFQNLTSYNQNAKELPFDIRTRASIPLASAAAYANTTSTTRTTKTEFK